MDAEDSPDLPTQQVTVYIGGEPGKPGLQVGHAERLTEIFFLTDASSQGPLSYDAWILSGESPADRIVVNDLVAMNRTMRARTAHKWWSEFIGPDSPPSLPWLQAIGSSWDIFEMTDDQWGHYRCAETFETAVRSLTGPGRSLSVITKLLHIKRPRFVPVLDSYVMNQLGLPPSTPAAQVIAQVRNEGRRNLDSLGAIQDYLRSRGIERTTVRIMDALVWSADRRSWLHSLAGMLKEWFDVDDGSRRPSR